MLVTVPLFSGHADAGKNDVGHHSRLGEEDVLHDEVLELGDASPRMIEVGVGHRRVLALNVHAADFTCVGRVDDLDHSEAGFSR